MNAYYFGCWDRVGHHLYGPDGRTIYLGQDNADFPVRREGSLDGSFCPRNADQTQGCAALHHVKGWTILAFWDRSVDDRHGSHSTFVLRGTLSFDEAVATAKSAFPSIWRRYAFEVSENKSAASAEVTARLSPSVRP